MAVDPKEIKLRYLPEVRVAFMRYTGPYGPAIHELWKKLHEWAASRKLDTHVTTLGLCLDNPMTTPPEKCRYDACIPVPWDFEPDGGAEKIDVPGGAYLLVPYSGSAAEIGRAWTEAMDKSLPDSNRTFDPSRPCMERYPADCMDNVPKGEFRCELCIPVKP